MKRNNLLSVILIMCSLSGCKKTDPDPVVNKGLSGNWAGDYQTQQAGSCSWSGPVVTATATFQVVNNTVTATVIQTAGPTSVPTQFTGTIDGNTVSLSTANSTICNGTPRSYISRFGGTINGSTLTLVSRDTICPAQGCIFLKTIKLTRQ